MNKKEIKKPQTNVLFPRSNYQLFTVAENKLLDQITLEITDAWAKDLTTIRKCHQNVAEMMTEVQTMIEYLKYKVPFTEFMHNQKEIYSFINDIRKEVIEMTNQITHIRRIVVKNSNDPSEADTLKKEPIKPNESKDKVKKWWKFW